MNSPVIDLFPDGAIRSTPSDSLLKLTGELTIGTVSDLHRTLLERLERDREITVDLSEVDACDTASLQLIYSLAKTAAQHKQIFKIAEVSSAVRETAACLGLKIDEFAVVPSQPAS